MTVLLTWNTAGRVRRQAEQATLVGEVGADVVCLQEVTPTTLRPWRDALRERGYPEVLTSMDEWIPGEPTEDDRRLGVLTATREPAERIVSAFVPWPERLLSVRLGGALEVHNLHSPISPKPDRVKVRTHEALFAHLAQDHELPQLLCGDLNTPRRERPDGTTWTFARLASGRLRLDRGERWDRAELALVKTLEEEHGWKDAFRTLHGYGTHEISWSYPRRRGGYRLDHVLVSPCVRIDGCGYLHAWREAGLSDHSGMWASFDLTNTSQESS